MPVGQNLLITPDEVDANVDALRALGARGQILIHEGGAFATTPFSPLQSREGLLAHLAGSPKREREREREGAEEEWVLV